MTDKTPALAEVAETRRSWNNGWRCAECCNGDRCDDHTHYERAKCPHCKGSGIALWNMYEKERDLTAALSRIGEMKREIAEARRSSELSGFAGDVALSSVIDTLTFQRNRAEARATAAVSPDDIDKAGRRFR